MVRGGCLLFSFLLGLALATPLAAQEAAPVKPAAKAAAKPAEQISIGYLRAYAPQLALSVLDVPPRDEGVAGANVAIADNNTTGSSWARSSSLDVIEVKPDADVAAGLQGDGGQGRALRARRPLGRPAAVDRRHRPATAA